MESPKQLKIKLIFIAAIVLLLSLSIYSYYKLDALIISSDRLNHTNVVKLQLESLFSRIKDADAEQRGFVLTKDSIYIRRYNHTLQEVSTRIDKLKAYTEDNYSQQNNIDTLQKLIDIRIRQMNLVITDVPHFTIPKSRWLEARATMAEIDKQVTKMMNEESFLLRLRSKSLGKEITITPLLTIFLTVCSLIVMILAYYGIHQELNISNELKSNLQKNKKKMLEVNHQLEENNVSLEKANKELESFTYISSHDLQEPLRKIQMMISRIIDIESENLSETGKSYMQRTHESANRMQALIRDLLAYSRVKSEVFDVENVNLDQLVDEVKNDLDEEIVASNAIIKVKGSPQVQVIVPQFRQLLTNLISNSIKFSHTETPPEITIENILVDAKDTPEDYIKKSEKYSKITISDNGIGFETQYEKRIFELFQRLHTNKEYPGTGIGLAIVKKIVDNHQGYIAAESPEGKGAVFTIYLPYT